MARLVPLALITSVLLAGRGAAPAASPGPPRPAAVSGVYPHLALFNNENECGIGAVVPWAGRLWAVTYPPHAPRGSSDKLYSLDDALNLTAHPESVGGTNGNRMIHRESNQLFLGRYVIDAAGQVRAIPPDRMLGRMTGNARHLTDPAGKVYYGTMEEGLYEVDVKTLSVQELYADEQVQGGRHADLPGYHGKGLYSGQGLLVYSNNGEHGPEAQRRPDIPSGCLAAWDGGGWRVVRRNQFTEVTGPGGIYGNSDPKSDPLWAVGWDHRSVLLMALDGGRWHAYRLPKASHCYDGAHGWNTEWPRIRDVVAGDLLMTMHGTFWRFPKTFAANNSAGVTPRSTYLKVVADFCNWGDRVVFACDDTAKNEFLNKRKAKGNLAPPGQSQSNFWFVDPADLDSFGPPLGRGSVWLGEGVKAGVPSDPYLFAGYDRRTLHLTHGGDSPVTFTLEVDTAGDGKWTALRRVEVPARGYRWVEFRPEDRGAWVRLRADRDCPGATAAFHYAGADRRPPTADPKFAGIASPGDTAVSAGLVRARGDNLRTLHFAATAARDGRSGDLGYYELDGDLKLKKVDDPEAHAWLQKNAAIPSDAVAVDAASVLVVDDAGRRWRLPKGDPSFDRPGPLGVARADREVCTERDLFNCHGTFYELPAENAGGFAKIRPVTTHNRRIHDYCSYRGLLVITGVTADAPESPHVVRSDDGKCALWLGVVDDLWAFGKPRGRGGPWLATPVQAGAPSDPYLMTGYDKKSLTLSHDAEAPVSMRVEADVTGTGVWCPWRTFDVPPGEPVEYDFPDAFQAYWVRVVAGSDCTASAQFEYR